MPRTKTASTKTTPLVFPYCYQIISRDNDRNGNAYRLAIVYKNNSVLCAIEFKDSLVVNYIHELLRKHTKQEVFYGLVPFHLTLREFKQTKDRFKHLGQFAEEYETETIASFFTER